jgi:TonB family protein
MMRFFDLLFAGRCIALAVSGLFFLSCAMAQTSDSASDGDTWPAHVVTLEQMRPLTPYTLKVRRLVAKGRVTGPAVLRVHVGSDGKVVRVSLLNSSGNPDLDEASLHAMRPMAFKPVLSDGVAIEVSMLVPVHVPARLGRSE